MSLRNAVNAWVSELKIHDAPTSQENINNASLPCPTENTNEEEDPT